MRALILVVWMLLAVPLPRGVSGWNQSLERPPQEKGPFRQSDLVELVTLDATIRLDIRYATPNNLAGRAVYSEARAFLQRPAAQAVVRAHRALKKEGYGLLIFDGYRPWSV